MKFSAAFLALTAVAVAAPAVTSDSDANSIDANSVPEDAILGHVQLSDKIIAWYSNETSEFVFLNNTVLKQAQGEASLGKREADADAKFKWVPLLPGQPIWKRDANAEAEADAKFKWVPLLPGQPIW